MGHTAGRQSGAAHLVQRIHSLVPTCSRKYVGTTAAVRATAVTPIARLMRGGADVHVPQPPAWAWAQSAPNARQPAAASPTPRRGRHARYNSACRQIIVGARATSEGARARGGVKSVVELCKCAARGALASSVPRYEYLHAQSERTAPAPALECCVVSRPPPAKQAACDGGDWLCAGDAAGAAGAAAGVRCHCAAGPHRRR